ncbi:hypothetical protein B4O97_04050 [Marispirochaeta aestuarii]|uniref:DISARM protein DrmE C-terminal domain-containing protein n=2 Tax=Marispirochaeta aestuarii TaxID=1963862 RepID=A0A1Y1S1J6_9SPIO|nr:hypothetical protein B4O97_04050 [Marispirochaeta aestuarii]
MEQREQERDFVQPDWEDAFQRHKCDLSERLLGSKCFMGIDRVHPTGRVVKGSRPVLGRYTSHSEYRPHIQVPANRRPGEFGLRTLAEADVVLADIQFYRGIRGRKIVSSILGIREDSAPTVIVAASPSDLLGLPMDIENVAETFLPVLPPPVFIGGGVVSVGGTRLSAQRSLDLALEGLSDMSGELDRLVRLARAAWWSLRQAVDNYENRELARYFAALERLQNARPEEASMLTYCTELLTATAADVAIQQERLDAAVASIIHEEGNGQLLVLVRDQRTALSVEHSVASVLGIDTKGLHELGVTTRWVGQRGLHRSYERAIVIGYSGMATLDAILSHRVKNAQLVMDPLEVRAAWYGANSMIELLKSVGQSAAAEPLESLMAALEPYVPPFADTAELPIGMDVAGTTIKTESNEIDNDFRANAGEVTLVFEDGTIMTTGQHTRFEVLGAAGGHTTVTFAENLQIGDKIVMLDDDSHELFSERRIAMLDAGVLKEFAAAREEWLLIVKSVYSENRPSLRKITRVLAERGHPVTYSTIRSWITFKDIDAASTPASWERFRAFAAALGVSLYEPDLRRYFDRIKRWRVLHRKAGRDLARAIRASYSSRLGPLTLAQIEREWGMSVSQLMSAAQMRVVDDIIKCEEEAYVDI